MKPENVAVVFTDADTGKPYAAVLNESETLIIMAMLSGLQDGAIRAREVIPFELRSPPANRIAEKQARLHEAARTGVQEILKMAMTTPPTFEYRGTTRGTIGPFKGMENLPKEPDDKALCYQCGEETRQRLVGDEWHCKACHAVQCERVRCESCGKTCTRPDGAHYCHGGGDAQ